MKKFNFIFFSAIIIFLPFLALLGNILEFKAFLANSQVFWLTHWYEILLPIVIVSGVYSAIKNKKLFAWPHLIALLVILYSIIIIIFSLDKERSLEGFRLTILPIVFFAIASLINFTKEERDKLINLYLTVAFIVAFWAILERFLPIRYWSSLGLIDPAVIFGWGWHKAGGLLQSASFLGGPNQLASYLLPALFLAFIKLQKSLKNKVSIQNTYLILFCVSFFSIVFSQSRSAIVGMILGFLIWFLCFSREKILIFLVSTLFVISFSIVLLFSSNTGVANVVTHDKQTGHQTALATTTKELKNRSLNQLSTLIFGSGLGTAGPLAMKYGNGIISESWYLQLFLEIGLIGLVLWLCFIIVLLHELLKKEEKGLFLGLLTVSVVAIFLHTWADNPAMAYTLCLLMGLYETENKK